MSGDNGGEMPAGQAGPVVVAQVVLDAAQRKMWIVPGPMIDDLPVFYNNLAAGASKRAAEMLAEERLAAAGESRKNPQILTPSSWPADLRGG